MRKYSKPLWTVAWTAFFLLINIAGLRIFTYASTLKATSTPPAPVLASSLPAYSWPTSLWKLEEGLAAHESLTSAHRTVLVGASYVMLLPDIAQAVNLGVGATNFSEHRYIIKTYCDPADTVIYFFTIYEAVHCNDPPRRSLTNESVRRTTILKGMADFANPKRRACMMLRQPPPDFDKECTDKQIERFSQTGQYSINPLYDIQREHPKTVFILHPMLPVSTFPDTPEAEHLKHMIAKLKADCASSTLPILDLSDALPASMFGDLFHLTEDGKSQFVSILQPLISNQNISSPL